MIECEYTFTAAEARRVGGVRDENPADAVGRRTYHYRLYVPEAYNQDTAAKYPILFIASAGGNARIGHFAERAKRDRWIVAMLVESRNGKPDWLANFLAAHDDVVKRSRVMDDMKFSTGMSGGSRCATVYPIFRSGFRGVLLQVAGFWYDDTGYRYDGVKQNRDLHIYGLFGFNDEMNYREIESTQQRVPSHTRIRMEIFDGGHSWAPAENVEHGFDWFERNLFLNPTVRPPAAAACVWYCENQLRKLPSATSDFERYELMEAVATVVKKVGLPSKSPLKKKAAEFKKEMVRLKRDKSVARELGAKRHFMAADRADTRDNRRKPAFAKSLAPHYLSIAKKYQGTVYAARAKARAESLERESKLAAKK